MCISIGTENDYIIISDAEWVYLKVYPINTFIPYTMLEEIITSRKWTVLTRAFLTKCYHAKVNIECLPVNIILSNREYEGLFMEFPRERIDRYEIISIRNSQLMKFMSY